PDLFWALRGGGGNFGVVTRFKYALHDVSGAVGGMLVLPGTPEVVRGFVDAAEAAPEDLSGIGNVMTAPGLPFLPPHQQGKPVRLAFIVPLGDVAAGERAIAPFRSLAKPIMDMLRPMAYPDIYPPEDPSYRPKPVQHTMFLNMIDDGDAQTIVERINASDAPLRAAQLRV